MHLRHLLTTPATRRRSAWIAYLGDKCSALRAALDSSEQTNRDLTRRCANLEQQLTDAHEHATPRPQLPTNERELQQRLRLSEYARANLAARNELLQDANEAMARELYDRATAPARTEAA